MIEIIRNGTKKRIDCNECGCLFSYEADDVEHKEVPSWKGGMITNSFIRCPQCHQEIRLSSKR